MEIKSFKKFDEKIDYNILKGLVTSQNIYNKTNFFRIETDNRDKFAGDDNNAINFALKLDDVLNESSYEKVEELLEWKHIENSVTITQFGIGILSMDIKVTVNKIDIDIIKQLDKRIEKELKQILKDCNSIILKHNNKEHSDQNKINPKDFYETLGLKTFNVCNYLWHHTIYWFADDNLLGNIDDPSSSIGKFFNTLLNQDINEKRYMLDRYIFFGWIKSLIITVHDKGKCENWIK